MSEKFLRSLTVGGDKMTFLPSVGTNNNEKVLKVIDGEWAIGTYGEVESTVNPWLTFSGNEDFTLSVFEKRWDGTLYYSTDTKNWNEWDGSEISSNNKNLFLRGIGNSKITDYSRHDSSEPWNFDGSANLEISAQGNIENLLDYPTVISGEHPTMGDCCYGHMFRETPLIKAPELPATTLTYSCYAFMFTSCKLVNAPELPATTLAEDCYFGMFAYCESLVKAPELPATTLTYCCYASMFAYCESLVKAPELPATTLADSCYSGMFKDCTGLNIYTVASSDASYVWTYTSDNFTHEVHQMFYNCKLDGATFPNDGTPTEGTTYYWATPDQ